MKKFSVLIFLFLSLYVHSCAAVAIELPAISMSIDLPDTITSPEIETNVKVIFNDISLYNDKVRVAYHIYDETGNLVIWESIRYPLAINEDNTAIANVQISLTSTGENKDYIIQFDLIDEQNLFWFSALEDMRNLNDMLPMVTGKYARILYEKEWLIAMDFDIDNIVILVVNIVVFLFSVFMIVIVRTKHLLRFRKIKTSE